ncbi:MAG TPA: UDP-4-amino-4,6-dideoxy-N-acetyl-beta-L-altrosamine transaminase [Steroidobacteraceae bacterium]|nr:UDP-4-amino-4,6-dideoxy-N-acetyl-beta-L-altrosamine transaminase [Steroidobacteraceae bacterium]
MIPYGRQDVTDADIEAAVEVLRSDFLTQGPVVPRFEGAVGRRVGVKHAVAVNSATSALHVACAALGLGRGDRLWTTPNTFVASANCGLYCGAEVDFVDIDPLTWNMSAARLEEKLSAARRSGQLPKIVVPVHFGGQPTDQRRIWELAREYGFKVLEDASHSIGALHDKVPVGNCRWSDVTVFSFHPVKIITSGEGGMALTNDDDVASRMEILRTHGITRKPERFVQVPAGPWHYEQQALGFNYRMTDIHAAIGLSQFQRLTEYVDRRNELAGRYDRELHGLAELPTVLPGTRSAFHLYVIRLRRGLAGEPHARIFGELRRQSVGVNLHYTPVHLQPFFKTLGFSEGQFPEAEMHGKTAITLPLYPRMTDAEHGHVMTVVRRVLGAAN